MTSEERHEARYRRRKAKRQEKTEQFQKKLGSYDQVFTFMNLYRSFYKCSNGVRWKGSIQAYERQLPTNIYEIYTQLQNRTWKSRGFTKFKLNERGKVRQIQSVHISERCIQRCLCDHYLVPLLERSLIYDNGASIKGKGPDFTLRRLEHHLKDYYKRYGVNGYILLFDFTNYFGNIDHEILIQQLTNLCIDKDLRDICIQLINAFDKGLGLGSQISQISAMYFANSLDHTFKDKMGLHYYARFSDDGYVISNNIGVIQACKTVLYDICSRLKISINERKIKICKIQHGFTYLKKRIRLTIHGNVVVRLCRKALFATKRRLRKMKGLFLRGVLSYIEILNAYKSWRGNAKRYKNYRSILKLDIYFNQQFNKKEVFD